MAYQVRKKAKISHKFELLDEEDKVLNVLDVSINIEKLIRPFRKKEIELLELERQYNADQDDVVAFEKVCKCIREFVQLIFGEEQTAILFDYYENETLKMFEELTPFIYQVIAPVIHEEAKQYRKMVANNLNMSKKAKRSLKKM